MTERNREPKGAVSDYKVMIENLKRALKQKQITYKELAEGLGLSESGIKKIFSAKDGSFQRLTQICRYIGISLSELIEDKRALDVGFTERQQSEFLKEDLLFQVYWLLVYERRSIDDIRTELRLNKNEAFRLCRKLDVLGLIKLLPGDRIRLPSIKAIRWKGDGEFMKKIYRDWSHNLVSDVAKPQAKADELFIIRYFQMTSKTYNEFINAQKSLEDEFVRRSIQEMRQQAPGLSHVRWLVAVDTRSFIT